MLIETKINLGDILINQNDFPEELIYKVYDILHKFYMSSKEGTIKINDEYVQNNQVRKIIYQKLNKDSFICVLKAITSTTSIIKKLQPYVISCFYNHAIGNMIENKQKIGNYNSFNNFSQNNYDFELLEKEILQN